MQYLVKLHARNIRFFSIFEMAPSAVLEFQIFKFVVVARIETTNVHRRTNFVRISRTVAEILHLTIFKMAAVRHLGFLNV